MILTFNAKTVNCEILEKTLVGRKQLVDKLYAELYEKSLNDETYQSLIVAPRGRGKTHLTKVIYCRLDKADDLKGKIVIAYMVEDEYGVTNLLHFLLRSLTAIVRYKVLPEIDIASKITELSQLPSKDQTTATAHFLREIIGNKKLVVLIENLDSLLSGMKDKGAELRDFMHEYNCLSLVATAQSLTDQFKDSKYPFYNFFKTRHLARLTFEECFQLIRALVAVEENEETKSQLEEALNKDNEIHSKIRAIYELTGGNHRLIVHFYDFLKADLKSDLSILFGKQMNDLKSYYEQFVGNLPVAQQRIVQLLSLNRQPLIGKQITQQSFLESNVVSKLLSELYKKGCIDKHKEGKNVYYEIKEPMMRICFEINEHPDGSAKLFVDFLKVIYDKRQRQKQFLKYKFKADLVNDEMKSIYHNEAQFYAKALNENEKNELALMEKKLSKSTLNNLDGDIDKLFDSSSMSEAYRTVFKLGTQAYLKKNFTSAIKYFSEAIVLKPKKGELYFHLGYSYYETGKYTAAIESYEKAIEFNPQNIDAINNLGNAYTNIKNFNSAIQAYEKAIEISTLDAEIYYNLGIAYYESMAFDEAIKSYNKAIEINPNYTSAHNNLGNVFYDKNDFGLAIISFKNAIEIKPQNAIAFINLGNAYCKIKDFEAAISAYEKAISNNSNSSKGYNSLALACLKSSKIDQAKDAIKKALKLEIFNPYYLGTAIQVSLFENDWDEALKILSEIHEKELEYSASMIAEDIHLALCSWTPDQLMLAKFNELEEYFLAIEGQADFYEAFTFATFSLLIDIEEYSMEKLQVIETIYAEMATKSDKVKMPQLFLKVGIDYLKNENKLALYELSKEERKIFTEQVLDVRKR